MSKQVLYVWCGVDASASDRMLWGAIRKLLQIGAKPTINYLEISDTSELDALVGKLEADGWRQTEFADEASIPLINAHLLSIWENQQNNFP